MTQFPALWSKTERYRKKCTIMRHWRSLVTQIHICNVHWGYVSRETSTQSDLQAEETPVGTTWRGCLPVISIESHTGDDWADWVCGGRRPTSWRDYISHLPWDFFVSFFFFFLESASTRRINLQLCFRLAPGPAAMKLLYCPLFAVHTNLSPRVNTVCCTERRFILPFKRAHILLHTRRCHQLHRASLKYS